MTDRLVLTDGGPYFHAEVPVGFHPALRAAAHLLLAAQSVESGLVRNLRQNVLPWHPPTLRRILSRHQSPTLDGSRPSASERDLDEPASQAVVYLDRLRRWTRRRFLDSPYVLEVLALTLSAWHEEEEQRRCGEPTRKSSDCGPWIDLLTAHPSDTDVTPLLRTLGELPHLRLPGRAGPNLRLVVPGWNPETEPYEAAEERLRRAAGRLVRDQRTRTERRTSSRSLRRLALRPAKRHFLWLARRQLDGWRPVQIARRYRVSSTSVHRALRPLAELLELELRPVKTGRPGL